ncbi:hypothetical protein D3H55_14140 [Bacillus salacetis]|uniref:Uncharacterized protein n=1 Tax=Bacillus salacetis TaxID=2315464 RepID=A0A3A1QXY8_9BACI|nr:hypothetical protein [Bacillus salacetis]RIW32016.1 hypothetical protein D3H55_14140 [Bacillus salacetis]
MKRHEDETEFDKTLKSLDSIQLDKTDKEEVFSSLKTSMEKQKGKNKVFHWSNHLLTAAFAAIFLIGGGYLFMNNIAWEQTAPQSENIKTIETVLKKIFSGPDEELKAILDNKETYIKNDNVQEFQSELMSYYLKEYGLYFEENRVEDYVMTNKLTFTELAYAKGYQLEAADIEITKDEESEDAYVFTVHVDLMSGGTESSETKVTGRINIYEEGKINTIRFARDGGTEELIKAIQTAE